MATEVSFARLSEGAADVAARVRQSVVQVQAGPRGMGSGVVWSAGSPADGSEPEARLITNAHVVLAARSRTLTLRLADGREIPATVVAVDTEHDLALLRATASGLRAIEHGDSAALRVGELVLAVGSPWGREGAVTVGVVAARAPVDPDITLEPAEGQESEGQQGWGQWRPRRLNLIQADIRLYPGNSGGPLTDARGRVVGINAMVGGGLGFAIPSRVVQQFVAEAGSTEGPVLLGVQVLTAPVSPVLRQRLGIQQETAVLIAGVEPGGAAEAAGLLVGDTVLAVDGIAARSAELLVRLLNRPGMRGQARTLSLLRGGEPLTLTLTPVPAVVAA